jgi:hypothetical protein
MNQEEFCKIAQDIYRSKTWQSKLARQFKINDRTVRRYAKGEHEIPAWLETELRTMNAALNPTDRALHGLEMAAAMMEEMDTEWAAIRDEHVVWILHRSEPIAVGVWDDERGIISPRLLADQMLLDGLSESVRAARGRH